MEMIKITCGACGRSFPLSLEEEEEEYQCPYCGAQTSYGICHRAGACIGRINGECLECGMLWTREIVQAD